MNGDESEEELRARTRESHRVNESGLFRSGWTRLLIHAPEKASAFERKRQTLFNFCKTHYRIRPFFIPVRQVQSSLQVQQRFESNF